MSIDSYPGTGSTSETCAVLAPFTDRPVVTNVHSGSSSRSGTVAVGPAADTVISHLADPAAWNSLHTSTPLTAAGDGEATAPVGSPVLPDIVSGTSISPLWPLSAPLGEQQECEHSGDHEQPG
ncbi:hypothetical protein [Actinosynnema sp. NPDC023587]|uniref:hypothetical protein n=1 Tax=Actinosynnema sp. NPDC023587 TaxID=3154695 RepID=UPI003409BE69